MGIIGRKSEQRDFLEWMASDEAELICVYGRRRVGKTYFVNELLNGYYAFDTSAQDKSSEAVRLRIFHAALREYGDGSSSAPSDWWEAFDRLKALLDRPECPRTPEGMRAVFIDELPWFDAPRSEFMNAFSDFWNRWCVRRKDVKLVICGSATSWILREVLQTEGSLNRRVTHSLCLQPFSLRECEEFLRNDKGIEWSRQQIIEAYMVFGGVPYYLRLLQARLSLAQNITSLCLAPQAPLKGEAKRLLDSTLSDKPLYYQTLAELGRTKNGLPRKELVNRLGVKDGQGFPAVLLGLEQCGYIRRYDNPYRKGRKAVYQLIDPFLLFSSRFIGGKEPLENWAAYYDTPSYNAWRGNAFEMVCLCHLPQLHRALSLEAMRTRDFPWESSQSSPGAQVDLVIERPDRITYLCEMKYTAAEFSVSAAYRKDLLRKAEVFKDESHTRNAVQAVIVAAAGFRHNANSDMVVQVVEGDDLFSS